MRPSSASPGSPRTVSQSAAAASGWHPRFDASAALCETVLGLPGLALDGLMTIGPAVAYPEAARPGFRALRALRDDVARRLGVELPHLSMGMSDDFAVAVEEGATLVRLGRALFGERGPQARREG